MPSSKTTFGQVRPGIVSAAWNRRESAALGLEVLLAALDDHVVRRLADDVLRAVGGRPEHAHRVVVRQHDVLDRLVGDGADLPLTSRAITRRRLGVDDHHRVVADHDPGVRIAFRRERVGLLADSAERWPSSPPCPPAKRRLVPWSISPACLLFYENESSLLFVVFGAVTGADGDLEGVTVALHAQGHHRARRATSPQPLVEMADVVEPVAVPRLQDVAALQAGTVGWAAP